MSARMGPLRLCWLLLVLVWPAGAQAERGGIVTMADGPLRLIREAAVYAVARGVALQKGDIMETASAGFAQLELADGAIVALGPDSRLFVFDVPGAAGEHGRLLQLVLLRGWIKAETPPRDKGASARYWSGALAVAAGPGSLVFHVTPAATQLFVEAGSADFAPAEKPRVQSPAKAGQFVVRDRAAAPAVRAGLPPGFVAEMPRAFQDTLPPLAQKFRQAAVAPEPQREVSYEDVADVLALPVSFRGGFIRRFESRLADAAFRHALDANMRKHPEWDRILHPEKYQPPKHMSERRPPE